MLLGCALGAHNDFCDGWANALCLRLFGQNGFFVASDKRDAGCIALAVAVCEVMPNSICDVIAVADSRLVVV